MKSTIAMKALLGSAAIIALMAGMAAPAAADETCQSPYMAKITGHEEFVYVWTLGMDGVGDESDKVVTIDVREGSPTFGQVVDVDSVGGQHEAHHGGFTDDRRFFWVAGLDTNQIFIFDVATDPGNPEAREDHHRLHREERRRRRPAWRLRAARPDDDLRPLQRQGHRRDGLVEYSNEGEYIATHWMPTAKESARGRERASGRRLRL
jgi:methanethiol oxidase